MLRFDRFFRRRKPGAAGIEDFGVRTRGRRLGGAASEKGLAGAEFHGAADFLWALQRKRGIFFGVSKGVARKSWAGKLGL